MTTHSKNNSGSCPLPGMTFLFFRDVLRSQGHDRGAAAEAHRRPFLVRQTSVTVTSGL